MVLLCQHIRRPLWEILKQKRKSMSRNDFATTHAPNPEDLNSAAPVLNICSLLHPVLIEGLAAYMESLKKR